MPDGPLSPVCCGAIAGTQLKEIVTSPHYMTYVQSTICSYMKRELIVLRAVIGNITSVFLWVEEGRRKSAELKVAIINFLRAHFTHIVNLSLKGIIYSSLHRLLNSKVKDFGCCKVCNTDDKAEKISTLANPPIALSPFFQLGSKGTFHQSQKKTIYNFKPSTDLLFPKGYALNLWLLPACFFPVRTSLSGVLRTPMRLRPGFHVSYLLLCWEPAQTSGSLTLPSNTKDKRERMKPTEATERVVLGSRGERRPRRRSIGGNGKLQENALHKKHFNPISATQARGAFVLVKPYNRLLILKWVYYKAQAKRYWNKEKNNQNPKSLVC